MSRYFIDRPIFAWVIAIVLMLAGVLAIRSLPVAQFPEIAPPAVAIAATYPGADAETLERTTTQVIEQQLKGIDNLRYFSSSSSSAGTVTITLTFEQGTDADIAQVQVQNKLQQATPLLPQEVQQAGLRVTKATANFLLVIAAYSQDGSHDQVDLGDLIASKLQDPLSRIKGVGDTQVFGAQYSMRIWVDPFKMSNLGVTVTDITSALTAQNARFRRVRSAAFPRSRARRSTPPSPHSRDCRPRTSSARSSSVRPPAAPPCASPTSRGSKWARKTTASRHAITASRRQASA